MTDDATLPGWIAADVSFEVVYGNELDKLWHVRGIIDGLAICRRWQSERRQWHYEALGPEFFIVNEKLIKRR